MPDAQDGLGAVRFAYIDSGPPPSSASPDTLGGNGYPTVACVPGHSYSAYTFARVLALAPSRGVRVIAVNRRDYAPSMLLTEEELEEARAQDEGRRTRYLRARGAEIARFVAYVAENIIGSENREPIALLGWSLATIFTVSCLAWLTDPSAQSSSSSTLACHSRVTKLLQGRLTRFFIHDSAYNVLGYEPIAGVYHPLTDPALASASQTEREQAFERWLTSYFGHPFHKPATIAIDGQVAMPMPDTDEAKLAVLMLRTDLPGTVVRRTPLANSEEDREAYTATMDLHPGTRSESVFYGATGVKPATLLAGLYVAIGASGESFVEEKETLLPVPYLKVVYLCGTQSLPTVQLGAWALAADENVRNGSRKVEVVPMKGGNHYVSAASVG